jgi:hypothetical protein
MSSNSPISEWSGQDSPNLDFDDSPQDNSHITPQNKPKMLQSSSSSPILKLRNRRLPPSSAPDRSRSRSRQRYRSYTRSPKRKSDRHRSSRQESQRPSKSPRKNLLAKTLSDNQKRNQKNLNVPNTNFEQLLSEDMLHLTPLLRLILIQVIPLLPVATLRATASSAEIEIQNALRKMLLVSKI